MERRRKAPQPRPIADSYGTFFGGWYKRIPRNPPFNRVVGSPPVPLAAGAVRETIDATVFDRWRENGA